MSKLKIRLFGLAFVLVCTFALSGTAQGAGNCIDVVVWAINPATGECRQFPNPCVVPAGWQKFYHDVCGVES
jgi:hypothetical protein